MTSNAANDKSAFRASFGNEMSAEELEEFAGIFGERAEPFWLDTPGDFIIATVEETGEFASEFGTVPQLIVTLERGRSAKTPEIIKGSKYVIRLFGKTLSGRKVPGKGDRIAVGNRGTVTNKKGTFDYTDLELKYL